MPAAHVFAQGRILGHHVQGIRVLGMQAEDKAEPGGETLGNFLPGGPAVVAAIDAAVVLLVQQILPGGMGQQLVGAYTPFRVAVGRVKVGADAFVSVMPAFSGVVGAKDAYGGNADPHGIGPMLVQRDAVETKAAETGLPLRAGGMVGQRGDFAPSHPPVIGAEQGRRLHSGVQNARLAGPPRLDVPEAIDGFAGIARKAGLGLRLLPGPAQVFAELDLRAEPHTVGGGKQYSTVAGVIGQVKNVAAGAIRAVQFPILAGRFAVQDKGPLAGANQQEEVAGLGCGRVGSWVAGLFLVSAGLLGVGTGGFYGIPNFRFQGEWIRAFAEMTGGRRE